MRFLFLLLTLILQLNVSGYNLHNPQENHEIKILTAENEDFNERSCILFRYYSPDEGMYISQDPIRIRGGVGLYSYVHNPNAWIDAYGLAKCSVTAAEEGEEHDFVLEIDSSQFEDGKDNEAIRRLQADIDANGGVYTYDPSNASSRREGMLNGIPVVAGKDRDEVPMAMFIEGGNSAGLTPQERLDQGKVEYINPSQNRSVGSSMGGVLRNSDAEQGDRVKIVIK